MAYKLIIHHSDAVADAYNIATLDEHGPASLGEAVRAEAEVIAADTADMRPTEQHEPDVFRATLARLLAVGEYRDALGIRWTLERVDADPPG